MKNDLAIPPQSIQAEQSVLGGLMLDISTFGAVQGVLSANDFYRNDHRIIFNAISQLIAKSTPVDILTLNNYLQGKGLVDSAGGFAYFASIAKETPSAANVLAYAEIVREKSLLRTIITVGKEMMAAAMDSEGAGSKSIISAAENKIFALAQQGIRGKRGFLPIKKVLAGVVDKMESDFENPPKTDVLGVPTGFRDLDNMTSGLEGGDLIIVAARPSQGKTALVMNIAEHVAVKQSLPVAIFSMEMATDQIARRLIAANSGVDLKTVREAWKVQDSDWPLISTALQQLGPSPMFIDDSSALSISGIRSRIMRLVAEISDEHPDGLGLIVIDYIQLMSSDNLSADNRNAQIEEITRGLKQLAKELSVPVVALSQLNRNLESRPNKRPVMSDLRESGAIEQDADLIAFIYRDEVYNPESVDVGVAELIIGKNRNGALGTVRLKFDAPKTRFHDLARGY